MSQDGILITILNINTLTRKLLIKPNVTARGFVLVNENQELMNKIEHKISEYMIRGKLDIETIMKQFTNSLEAMKNLKKDQYNLIEKSKSK